MSVVKQARQAVERSRAERYLGGWDDTLRELTSAAAGLQSLENDLRQALPPPPQRLELQAELEALRGELRTAERIHQQAAAWESSWALAVQDALGLQATAYGPDGTPSSGNSLHSKAWEG